jgi:L-2,4-diaminobutyrate transaminase
MPEGNIIGFAPRLCLTPAEADEIVDRMGKALDAVF